MRRITNEEKIGAWVSLTALLVGTLAYILLSIIITDGILLLLFFPLDYSFFVLLIATAFWGSRAGVQIIRENKHDDWTGIKTVLLILLTFLASRILVVRGVERTVADKLISGDFLEGLRWLIGAIAIPTIAGGIFIGRRLKKYTPQH